MRRARNPSRCASARYSSTIGFTSRGGTVCKSKTSVIGIRIGSSSITGTRTKILQLVYTKAEKGDLFSPNIEQHETAYDFWSNPGLPPIGCSFRCVVGPVRKCISGPQSRVGLTKYRGPPGCEPKERMG